MLACRLTLRKVTYRHKRGARPRGCEDFLHDHFQAQVVRRADPAHGPRRLPSSPSR